MELNNWVQSNYLYGGNDNDTYVIEPIKTAGTVSESGWIYEVKGQGYDTLAIMEKFENVQFCVNQDSSIYINILGRIRSTAA